MSLVVQKYGGSSVGSPEKIKFVAQKIANAHLNGQKLVVVVSAMADTTDDLIELSQQVSSHVYEREMDMLLTAGERISMALLSMALRDLKIDSISFTGSQSGIITDESHTRARILEIKPVRIQEALSRNQVIIVAGFQGVSRSKEITTLGRGGSDTTAVALASKLNAKCEIYTDVEGIYSADPRMVEKAKRFKSISHSFALELTTLGAQVMHPRSIEIAREYNIPLFVGSTKSGVGTMIETTKLNEMEVPKVVAITSKVGLNMYEFKSNEVDKVLETCKQMNLMVYDFKLNSNNSCEIILDAAETKNFYEVYKNNLTKQSLGAVSCVGYQLQQNLNHQRRALEILKSNTIACVGLTCHAQSFTVFILESNINTVVKAFHHEWITNE